MGTKRNPGAFDCMAAALPDEPFFVLLARDPSMPALTRQWAAMRNITDPQEDGDKIAEAFAVADQAEAWRKANDGKWRITVEPANGSLGGATTHPLWRSAVGVLGDFGNHMPEDLDAARVIASAAIQQWGDLDGVMWEQFQGRGIWNDHDAVQSALAALRLCRDGSLPAVYSFMRAGVPYPGVKRVSDRKFSTSRFCVWWLRLSAFADCLALGMPDKHAWPVYLRNSFHELSHITSERLNFDKPILCDRSFTDWRETPKLLARAKDFPETFGLVMLAEHAEIVAGLPGFVTDADFEPIRPTFWPSINMRSVLRLVRERSRQVTSEGYDAAHDDQHTLGDMALAAASMATAAYGDENLASSFWPWDAFGPKAATADRYLEKAGALILAEMDRRDRLAVRNADSPGISSSEA